MSNDPVKITATMNTEQLTKLMQMLDEGTARKVVAHSVNLVALRVEAKQRADIQDKFILRNNATLKFNKIYKANEENPKPISRISAVIGSGAYYMPVQEKGGIVSSYGSAYLSKHGIHGVPVPTSYARGGNWHHSTLSRYNVKNVLDAKANKRFVLFPTGKKLTQPGIFERVKGAKIGSPDHRKPFKNGKPLKPLTHLEKIYTIVDNIKIKATHWHSAALDRFATKEEYEKIFKQQFEEALSHIIHVN